MKKTMPLSRWQLIKMLRQHSKLSDERSLNFKQKKIATYLGYGLIVIGVLYLMFLAVMLSLIANSSHHYTAAELMFGLMPFILVFDFFTRFSIF